METIKIILIFIWRLLKYIVKKGIRSIWRKCRYTWCSTSKYHNTSYVSINGQSMPEYCIGYYLQKYQIIFKYRYKKKCVDSKRREIDFYLPTYNIGIEYDGAYWHKNKVNKDIEKNLMLQKENIKMIRLREKGLGDILGSDDIIINDLSNYSTYKFLNEPLKKLFTKIGINNSDINIERDFNNIILYKNSVERLTA